MLSRTLKKMTSGSLTFKESISNVELENIEKLSGHRPIFKTTGANTEIRGQVPRENSFPGVRGVPENKEEKGHHRKR